MFQPVWLRSISNTWIPRIKAIKEPIPTTRAEMAEFNIEETGRAVSIGPDWVYVYEANGPGLDWNFRFADTDLRFTTQGG